MASLNSILTIKFDPDDRALLERVAGALERKAQPLGPDPDDDHFEEEDDDEEDENPRDLSAPQVIGMLATYLSCEASPAAVLDAVKDIGSQLQDLRDRDPGLAP